MEKYNVLIVDDEVHAVRGIEVGVDWDRLGVSAVFTAHDKKQAQTVFHNHRIDLLLSDIDMPKGSGLDLLAWVREEYSLTEAIFISCHSDFTFAKQALSLRSFNYLLKPIDYKELEDEIKAVLEKIHTDREMNQVGESFLTLQKEHHFNQKERFWKHLIDEYIYSSKEEISLYLHQKNLDYDMNMTFLPILTHIYNSDHDIVGVDKLPTENDVFQSIRDQVKKDEPTATTIQIAPDYFLFILQREKGIIDEQRIMKQMNQIIFHCNADLTHDVCFYVGLQVPIDEVVPIVKELRKLGKDNMTMINKTIHLRDHHVDQSYYIPQVPKDKWIELMNISSNEKISLEITKYIASWENNQEMDITRQTLRLFYQDFLQVIFYILQTKGLEATKVFSNQVLMSGIERLETIDDFRDWILFLTRLTMEQIRPVQESNSVIDHVKQFIKEHIGTHGLTRDDIANHVYLNSDYLTRIFKKQTGMSLAAYLRSARMNHAKQLLIHTDMPVSTIALDCGYTNFSYFSTLFKKSTELNPVEFRKKHAKHIG